MNTEQIMSLLRDLLKVGGTIALMLGVASTTIDSVTSLILSLAGPISMVIGIVWSLLRKTPAAIVQSASALPEVKAMTVTDPALATAARQGDPATRVQVEH